MVSLRPKSSAVQTAVAVFLLGVFLSLHVHGQTFQYSRGWTNGKRSGGLQPFERDGAEEAYDILFPHFPSRIAAARLRTLEPQYVVKRMAESGSSSKKPYWLRAGADDESDLESPSSPTNNPSSHSRPASNF